jgi:hypothetical protein
MAVVFLRLHLSIDKPECVLEGKVSERGVLIDLKRSRYDPGCIRICECQRIMSR